MNEDIGLAFLALEASIKQQNQQIADLQFQVRQLQRDVVEAQRRIGTCADNVDHLKEGFIRNEERGRRAVWLGWTT
jgi:hypothetical protein